MGADNAPPSDVTASGPQSAPAGGVDAGRIESEPMSPLAPTESGGVSDHGTGMSFSPPSTPEITGSVRSVAPPPLPPTWTWEGGTPIIVGSGETLDTLSRQYGVPAYAIMQANNIAGPGAIHAGQHLVIPRRRSSRTATAYAPPR